jgi:hypothetical protein
MSNLQLHVPHRNGYPPVDASSCGHVRDGHLTITREPLDSERRRGHVRIPDDLRLRLSKPQLTALPGIQYAGWDICFLRERPFMDPEVVLYNREDSRFGIMDIDGSIRAPGELKVRRQAPQDSPPEMQQTLKHTYITV